MSKFNPPVSYFRDSLESLSDLDPKRVTNAYLETVNLVFLDKNGGVPTVSIRFHNCEALKDSSLGFASPYLIACLKDFLGLRLTDISQFRHIPVRLVYSEDGNEIIGIANFLGDSYITFSNLVKNSFDMAIYEYTRYLNSQSEENKEDA